MWTGKQTLSELNQAMSSIRNDIHGYDKELNAITQALTHNQHEQAQLIKTIAGIRLDELDSGTLIGDLDRIDHEVIRLLEKRVKIRAELEEKIQAAEKQLADLEAQRVTVAENVEAKAETVIQAEHDVQQKLEADAEYLRLLEEARQVDSVADEAESKADVAEQDRIEKGRPFERDKLFVYLWDRDYGTTEYQANLLTRALDGWVAGLCNYQRNRATYWTLLEIPKRLQQHAQAARDLADRALADIEAYELTVAQRAAVPELQSSLQKAEEELEKLDARIDTMASQVQELLDERAQLSVGDDAYSKAGLAKLSEALQRYDIYTLDDKVKATSSPKDDGIVRDLRELHDEAQDLREDLNESRRHRDAQTRRFKELEEVRREFKRRRYDDVRSGFGKEEIIASMLGQFLRGVINGADLWGTMKRHQRHRDVGAWPDFGSGGLGRSSRRRKQRESARRRGGRNVWHNPGRRSGGGFRLPKNGGSSSRGRGRSGGFKTGGGF